jgi:excinuclease ABC subunit A
MQFLSDQYIRCAECEGKRYQPYLLAIKLQGKSIHDVLELTVTQAITFFRSLNHGNGLIEPLELLKDVGLGYLRLGQPVNNLSGGESQRLKLVGHLAEKKKSSRHSLLIFDEPTTGLHFDDIAALLHVFHRLVDKGNTVIVIEHNLDVIHSADYLIDLGPEAGDKGGMLVGTGTPEELAKNDRSHTGLAIRRKMLTGLNRTHSATARIADAPLNSKKPEIVVQGARHHNLKNLTLRLPQDKMVVVTGLSGSGKSSLAFDILFAEGQRRFMDSMSTYARQFVEQLERPDVDHVEGLPPSVAIEQRLTQGSGKSTVATLTEVYHFLRLLFAKLGTQYCPKCSTPVAKMSSTAILRQVAEILGRGPATLIAPLVKARKGYHKEIAVWAEREGYEELVVDGYRCQISDFPSLERYREHSIEVVIGELNGKAQGTEMQNLLKKALKIGNGSAFLLAAGIQPSKGNAGLLRQSSRAFQKVVLSTEMSCPTCGDAFEELDPRLFSFNSPHGWCPTCNGFGFILPFSAEEDDSVSRLEAELTAELRSDSVSEEAIQQCPECRGTRLNKIARSVRIDGYTIDKITGISVREAARTVKNLKFSGPDRRIGADILSEIIQRLSFMREVGLDYLTLDRSARTLSGGESQRIRLAAQLGSNLRGVLYVLDEPSIGLHPRDNARLLDTLRSLKAKGNTLVVVEHDEETMQRADLIVDLGPGAGRRGGELIALGSIDQIKACKQSTTGKYLQEPMPHPIRSSRRTLDSVDWLEIFGARANNLKEIDVRFPVGRLSVITGVSGSGKSTLLRSVLLPAVREHLGRRKKTADKIFPWTEVSGTDRLGGIFEVDQSPIGKTSRSIPATYVKIFDDIRSLFGQLPESRIRGYNPSRFSFNTEGGRCEICSGQGVIKLEMNFLPSSYIPCEACEGKRFNPQTLEIRFNEKSIGDILEMTIEEAVDFFRSQPRIHKPLELLARTGLGYLQLGQPSPTLSGGEAQRLKLVSELKSGVAKGLNDRLRKNRIPKSTLYLLEEPTIGLHMADVQLLIEVLHRLVDDGNTVIVIEHNLDVIAEADYIVDIGPEAGDNGGEVVAAGSPEEVARSKESRTAPFIREILRSASVSAR